MSVLRRISEPPQLDQNTIMIVGCIRNEALRLPDFLAHHRRLGVGIFLLIDNGSEDDSVAYLLSQPDVCLFHTDDSYSQSNCGVDWLNELLAEYGVGRWVLILDADELFVYPDFEHQRLGGLIAWLDARNADAVVAPMLDMYPEGPVLALNYKPGQSLIAACPLFDGVGYLHGKNDKGPSVINRGGPRHRLFWDQKNHEFQSPFLKKIPFVRWQSHFALTASTHILQEARPASLTGLLLHFKFLQNFAHIVQKEAERAEHFMGARQYRAYAEVITSEPELRLDWQGSVRYRDSRQLVDLGFMHAPDDWPAT
jgi:glycosyltransferase involved in cell wall biosynthesis